MLSSLPHHIGSGLLPSRPVMSDFSQPQLQHARPPCPSPSPGFPRFMSITSVMPSSHLILWCPLLLPSIFPSIRVSPMSCLFASDDQNIGTSASASVLPMSIQGWFPVILTDSISLLSKGLSRVFSITTVKKTSIIQCLSSFWSHSHIHTWLLERP